MATYTVKKGDNLSSIAKRNGTTTAALIAANKAKVGANPNKIFSGTVLTIPGSASSAPPAAKPPAKKTPGPYRTATESVTGKATYRKPAAKKKRY